MIFLMTKDSFLLHGLMNLKDDRKVIKINNLYDINNISDMPFKVVIDTYHNHILDEESMEFLASLNAVKNHHLSALPYQQTKK